MDKIAKRAILVYNIAKFINIIIMCNQNNPEGGHKCCGWLIGNKYRHQTLRAFFWVLIILGFVMAVGAGIETARAMREKKTAMRFAKAGYFVEPTVGGYRVLPRLIFREKEEQKPVIVFGEITQIESNKVTILNNGAAEQVVLSMPDTKITLGDKEIGISSLGKGQAGTFAGFYNKDNQLEAKEINLK